MGLAEEAESVKAAGPKVLVCIPEQIDTEWYWYYYTEMRQHLVQSAVEKQLIRSGVEVVDLSGLELQKPSKTSELGSSTWAIDQAKIVGADYVVSGRAEAVNQGRSEAYGLTVFRVQATATAKLIRVSDGKVIDVFEAEGEAGGQAQKAAALDALKLAGKALGKDLRNFVSDGEW